ncbi:GNAT family N-acetyltransferase [Telmatospirillum sp. J64-1]|uniref:GNAT family N-acetyltransferase n=1 Tax=Telmatospirillum sp. J64-1 TaxID=2502183 RepID=UPI00115E54AB|nr:GNAT family N-acetyltransferase [Telmatospirillum sp. J64-1]
MAPAVTIRPARPEDAGLLLRMIGELAQFERAAEPVKATEQDILRDGFGDHPRFEALIAEKEGQAAGYILFFPTWSSWQGRSGVMIHDLWVRPEARRSGIGAALLKAVAAQAVRRGCTRLDLDVLDWNTGAQDFYARMGLERLEEWYSCRISGDRLKELAEG